mgnify:FL=1
MSLTNKILLGMILGIFLGSLLNNLFQGDLPNFIAFFYELVDAIGRIFLSLLKLLVVPLVFVSLVVGVSNLTSDKQLLSISSKAIGLYLFTTALAIVSALFVSSFFDMAREASLTSTSSFEQNAIPSLKDTFVNLFPSNPIKAMAEGNMIQIIIFAMLFGYGLNKLSSETSKVKSFFFDLNEIILNIVNFVIWLSPLGVFCLIFSTFSSLGISIIFTLINYFLIVVFVLIFHALFSYSFLLIILAKVNPLFFFTNMREAILFAFSTSSSSATMPVTLKTVEEKLGVNKSVSSFCIPLGTTINMDGTAIMQGVATVFIAQVYQVDLSMMEYLMVIITATLASVGTAGVPGVGLIMLAMVLQQVGLPVEGIALIIGVDRLLDMLRTAVNVSGDATISCIVANSENQLTRNI